MDQFDAPYRAAPFASRADRELAEERRRQPPWSPHPQTGGDRADALLRLIPTREKIALLAALDNRWFRVCEVGVARPYASTRHFEDHSSLIVLSSGFIAFMLGTARILAGGSSISDVPGAMTPDQTDTLLLAHYAAWRTRDAAALQAAAAIGLEGVANDIGFLLGETMLLAVLMHELGHVARHAAVTGALTRRQEAEADDFALEQLLHRHAVPHRSFQAAAAGATMAVRALRALELAGHGFASNVPPARHRLARLRHGLRPMVGDAQCFYQMTTTAFATEERMEAAEAAFPEAGPPPAIERRTEVTAARMVSRLYSQLIEVERGNLAEAHVAVALLADAQAARPVVLARAGRLARTALSPQAAHYLETTSAAQRYRAMVSAFDRVIATLPAGLNEAFAQA